MLSSGVDLVGAKPAKYADVVLGEDWIGPDAAAESEARSKRDRRGVIAMNRSPLARKIITFNLLAILVLVAGVLFLNPFRDSLVFQRERGLVIEAELISGFFEAQLPKNAPVSLRTGDGLDIKGTLAALQIPTAVEIFVYDKSGELIASTIGQERRASPVANLTRNDRRRWQQVEMPHRQQADKQHAPHYQSPPPTGDLLLELLEIALSHSVSIDPDRLTGLEVGELDITGIAELELVTGQEM